MEEASRSWKNGHPFGKSSKNVRFNGYISGDLSGVYRYTWHYTMHGIYDSCVTLSMAYRNIKKKFEIMTSCDLLHVCSPASSIFAIVQHPDSHQQLPTPATTWRSHSCQLLKRPKMRNSSCKNSRILNPGRRTMIVAVPFLLASRYKTLQNTSTTWQR